MCDTNIGRVEDLIEVDLGPGARGYFTTRGLRARPVPGGSGVGAQVEELDTGIDDNAGSDGQATAYSGWNLALHVGDDPQRVHSHRRRLETLLGLEPDRHLAWMNQVHSAVVAEARVEPVPTADALILDVRATSAPAGRLLRSRSRLRTRPAGLARRLSDGGGPCRAPRHAQPSRPHHDRVPPACRSGAG